MKKSFTLFILAAALFSVVALTPSAEAGFGLPKIKIPNVGGAGGPIANHAKSMITSMYMIALVSFMVLWMLLLTEIELTTGLLISKVKNAVMVNRLLVLNNYTNDDLHVENVHYDRF